MSTVVINFDGEIEDFPLLVQSIDNLVAGGTNRIVLDLDTLPFINSAALGYLIKVQKTLRKLDGEVVLSRLRPGLENVLAMTQLDAVFPSFESTDDAVRHFGEAEAEERAWR